MPFTKKFKTTLYNEKWLREHYEKKNLNACQIADLIGCDSSAVGDALRGFKIPLKTPKQSRAAGGKRGGSHVDRPRAKFISTLHNKKWLRDRFLDRKMTMSAIAREAECSVPSVLAALKKHLGLESGKHPSIRSADRLRSMRHRTLARRLHYKNRKPCIICGDKGTLNHIDADPSNNDTSNVEWLCRSHHLMVDKRLAGKAVRWFRKRHMKLWMQWHEEILSELHENPNPLPN